MANLRRAQVHNAAVVLVGALLFFAGWVAVEHVSTPIGQPLWATVTASPFAHAVLGAALFFVLRGHPLVRVALAVLISLVSAVIFEIALGSDPAYPYIALLFGGLAALAFLIGASVAAGLSWAVNRNHAKEAT